MALVPRGLEANLTQEKKMDIQSSAFNKLFVLYPLIIQGWVSPVKPADIAHGGIPEALFKGDPKVLECLVDPWTELQLRSWTMAVDDRVDLYCNGNLVPGAGQTVKPGEETLRQRLYLPHGILMHGVNRLHYVVTRVGGDFEPSRDLLVLYHLRPADNLDLVIPADVLKDGVSAERARLGVKFEFPYANRRDYDRIEFLLGDTQVRFDVPDGTAPITHTLFTDTFQKAGDNPSAVAEFYVVDQLGNRTKSPEKRLDIHLAAVVPVPTLTNVRDANDKEIPNAGITTSTTLKLTGTASKGKEVEIYDGSGPSAVPKGKATADARTGLWELTITVPAGARRLYAKSLYHSGNVYSNVRTLTVEAGLIIDPSPLILDGPNYSIAGSGLDWIRTGNDPEGTAGRKDVSGGTPPYRYLSSSTTVASVDSTGLVRSEGNGTAIITVFDDVGNSKTFDVNVTNVKTILVNHQKLYHEQGVAWITSVGGTKIVTGAGWQAFSAVVLVKYMAAAGPNLFLHTGEPNGPTVYHIAITPNNPERWIYQSFAANGQRPTICIR
jgi:hypothetical protein